MFFKIKINTFKTGTFIEKIVTTSGIGIEQRTFAHRSITPLLVTQIIADFSQSSWLFLLPILIRKQ